MFLHDGIQQSVAYAKTQQTHTVKYKSPNNTQDDFAHSKSLVPNVG